jgi:hypothetical protein
VTYTQNGGTVGWPLTKVIGTVRFPSVSFLNVQSCSRIASEVIGPVTCEAAFSNVFAAAQAFEKYPPLLACGADYATALRNSAVSGPSYEYENVWFPSGMPSYSGTDRNVTSCWNDPYFGLKP